MVLREIQVIVEALHDRHGQDLSQAHHRFDGSGFPARSFGYRQRVAGGGEDSRCFAYRARIRSAANPLWTTSGLREFELLVRFGQHLARQCQIDRSLWLRGSQRESPIQDALELAEVPQLIVPLDKLAHDAPLVEGFLSPVDMAISRPTHP